MKIRSLLSAVGLCGCAAAHVHSEPARPAAPPVAEQPRVEHRDAPVQVSGIEGTLSSFEVRDTLDRRGAQFGACHEPRARAVPGLHGQVQFAVHVRADGSVGSVSVRASDLGDRTLERCLSGVIADSAFPRPHGGEADVTWSMILEPVRATASLEQWDEERVTHVVERRGPGLRESCAVAEHTLSVTAYVNKRGRVIAAGVSSEAELSSEQLDCAARALRAWPMPRAKSRFAKVSFALVRSS